MVGNDKVKARYCAIPQPANTCAVVVAYYPDAGFENRLQQILYQVERTVVIDNTPNPTIFSSELRNKWGDRLHIVQNETNKGIAAAVNQGLSYAAANGFTWLLTLDQDTNCHLDMLATLAEAYVASPLGTSVIGSNYYDPVKKQCKIEESDSTIWKEQKTVISSGCLMDISISLRIGGMREDYFIDQVDHEFCLRARANGGKVIITKKPAMDHSVGLPGGVYLPWIGILPNHPSTRKYYIARNTITTVLAYWRREPIWCIKRITKLISGMIATALFEGSRREKIIANGRGLRDGLLGRMGPIKTTN